MLHKQERDTLSIEILQIAVVTIRCWSSVMLPQLWILFRPGVRLLLAMFRWFRESRDRQQWRVDQVCRIGCCRCSPLFLREILVRSGCHWRCRSSVSRWIFNRPRPVTPWGWFSHWLAGGVWWRDASRENGRARLSRAAEGWEFDSCRVDLFSTLRC